MQDVPHAKHVWKVGMLMCEIMAKRCGVDLEEFVV